MRRSIHLVALTGLIATTFLPIARTHEHPPGARAAGGQGDPVDSEEDPWPGIIANSSLTGPERTMIGHLRPWLDPDDYRALDPDRRKQLLRYARNRLLGAQPLARCWAPDTPQHILFAFHSVDEAAIAQNRRRKANQFFNRWDRTADDGPGQAVQGRPITLSWSIVPDGTPIASNPAIGDSDDPSSLRARLNEIYGGNNGPPAQQPWFPVIRNLFEAIGAQTGITYRYEPNDDGRPLDALHRGQRGIRGDLRLGGHFIDGTGDTLAYNYFPDHGDMVIDTSDSWFEDLSNNSQRLVNTFTHEHGHGLGLEHVCPIDNTKLLEPFINTGFRGMQFDEIYTLQRWYGDPFEQHGNARDNDTIQRAYELDVAAGSPFSFHWLSIDDNTDIDYFALGIPAGAQLTARIIPSSAVYLEGEEGARGCSTGATFDSSRRHDLSLKLVDPRGQALATSESAPAGEPEELSNITVPGGGAHFLKVTGDDSDAAQLYRLEVEIHPPSTMIEPGKIFLVNESHAPANGRIEPDETIELSIELTNSGSIPGANVNATLSAPGDQGSITGFQMDRNYGVLSQDAVVRRNFTLALHGECGDVFSLQLEVEADDGFARIIPIQLELGEVTTLLGENFERSGKPSLPPGWTSTATRSGTGWRRSEEQSLSGDYSAFAGTLPALGTSTLTSPPVTMGSRGGLLRFRHFLDTEASLFNPDVGFDGGVLEVSRDAGPWEDIQEAGGRFTQGGYNRILSESYQNPLPNRRAWSGSLGWIPTAVRLPPGFARNDLRFRWILGHDTSEAEEGWHIDEISVSSATCADTRPIVRMEVLQAEASELLPLNVARLSFSTPLPRGVDLPLPLLSSGSATPGVDTQPFENVVLPAGHTNFELPIRALPDGLAEGPEILVLSLDPQFVAPAGVDSARITISDTPYGNWAHARLGPDPGSEPGNDFDLDGWSNFEEFAWQSDPASPQSHPTPLIRREGNFLRVDFPHNLLPPFTAVRVETSTDLRTWTIQEAERLPNGFRLPADGTQGYLRLRYDIALPP